MGGASSRLLRRQRGQAWVAPGKTRPGAVLAIRRLQQIRRAATIPLRQSHARHQGLRRRPVAQPCEDCVRLLCVACVRMRPGEKGERKSVLVRCGRGLARKLDGSSRRPSLSGRDAPHEQEQLNVRPRAQRCNRQFVRLFPISKIVRWPISQMRFGSSSQLSQGPSRASMRQIRCEAIRHIYLICAFLLTRRFGMIALEQDIPKPFKQRQPEGG